MLGFSDISGSCTRFDLPPLSPSTPTTAGRAGVPTAPGPAARVRPEALDDPGNPPVVGRGVPRSHREGELDGAWWPRSRDITGEFPGLVPALSTYLGPVARVGKDRHRYGRRRPGARPPRCPTPRPP
ncbi:DUF5994 family protein [Streptomyces tendae]